MQHVLKIEAKKSTTELKFESFSTFDQSGKRFELFIPNHGLVLDLVMPMDYPIDSTNFIMRLLLIITPLLLLASCDKPENSSNTTTAVAVDSGSELATLKAAYRYCGQYGDMAAAAPIAFQLIAAEPNEAAKWKGELAKMNFASKRYDTCLLILDDLIKNHSGDENQAVLEMKALCYEVNGQKQQALDAWQMVWRKIGGAAQAVRVGGLQFELNLLDDALGTITAGLSASDANTALISLPQSREQTQQIPAAAALHNLKALVTLKADPKAKDAARTELLAALAIVPDFELAKRNLAGLKTEATPK